MSKAIELADEVVVLWDNGLIERDDLEECADELRRLAGVEKQLEAAQAELAAIRALEPVNSWASLWYFVMDEAPIDFERIVTTFSPSLWHQEAHKLMRKKYPAKLIALPEQK